MAANFPNGTVLIYKGQWNETALQTGRDILNKVSARLVADGLTVKEATTDQNEATAIFQRIYSSPAFNVMLTLQVANGLGYGKLDDVISIIRHEVFQVTDRFPTSDSIPVFTLPGGSVTNSGQPNPGNTKPDGTPKNLWDTVSEWFKNLGSNTTFIVALVGVGFVAAILLIAEHPIRER